MSFLFYAAASGENLWLTSASWFYVAEVSVWATVYNVYIIACLTQTGHLDEVCL